MWKSEQKEFPKCPPGPQQVVCCDVVDLGLVWNDKFQKNERKTRLVFQTRDTEPGGSRPYQLSYQSSVSLNEKANLRKFLEQWLGRPLTGDEITQFDPEQLIGKNGFASVVHRPNTQGKVYANIATIMPVMPGMTALAIKDYIRVKDRAPKAGPGAPQSTPVDDDIPF